MLDLFSGVRFICKIRIFRLLHAVRAFCFMGRIFLCAPRAVVMPQNAYFSILRTLIFGFSREGSSARTQMKGHAGIVAASPLVIS